MINYEPLLITTNRLILRKALLSDAQAMYRNWSSEAEVTKYLSWYPHTNEGASLLILELWRNLSPKERMTMWIIEDKSRQEAIGSISLMLVDKASYLGEIGFCLGKAFWDKGYATESLAAIIKHGFTAGYEKLICRTRSENIAAKKVIEKNKMTYKETKKVFWLKDYEYKFIDIYEITKKE